MEKDFKKFLVVFAVITLLSIWMPGKFKYACAGDGEVCTDAVADISCTSARLNWIVTGSTSNTNYQAIVYEDIYAGIEFPTGSAEVQKLIHFLQTELGVSEIRFPVMDARIFTLSLQGRIVTIVVLMTSASPDASVLQSSASNGASELKENPISLAVASVILVGIALTPK